MADKSKILYLSYNQDQGCFACGTEKGFRVYRSYPYAFGVQRDLGGGIGIVSMLYKSNLLALVGGGGHPKYPLTKVMLWDDDQLKCIGELIFKFNVRAVRMNKQRIAIALDHRIYVYLLSDLKLVDAVDTDPNPLGLCALSSQNFNVLACPDKKKGYLRLINYDTGTKLEKQAHDSSLSVIALTQDGKYCATTSNKGTLIRLFSTEDGKLLQEMRRGSDKAEIQSIAIDPTARWVACTSDKGTINIFSTIIGNSDLSIDPTAVSASSSSIVRAGVGVGAGPGSRSESGSGIGIGMGVLGNGQKEEKKEVKSAEASIKFKKDVISYYSSEWSLAQFHIPVHNSLVAFCPGGKPLIIGTSSG